RGARARSARAGPPAGRRGDGVTEPAAGTAHLLDLNGVEIEDTFAEAFKMRAARVIVTAETRGWARTAASVATGYATSVIGCDAEAGVEAGLDPARTPGGGAGGGPPVFGVPRAGVGQRAGDRDRPVRDDLADHGVLRRPPGRRGDRQGRRLAPVLRGRLPGQQEARQPPLLAGPGDGRRVPVPGDVRRAAGGGRRQLP